MNHLAAIPAWAIVPVSLLLVIGGSIVLIGALGLLRLPSFYQRIHGPAITVTLGAGCLLVASMIYFTVLQSRPVIHEIIISVFLLLTAPIVAMMIMRAAVYRDLRAGKKDAGVAAGGIYRFPEEDAQRHEQGHEQHSEQGSNDENRNA
ncbi:MAG TPA: monovalent cation/H(+) antiporter subunit G [Oxalicibacterium sp.]|nr:monovalent cation/H(+) antiporter subunit G [Oxalicibacterium sp.]